MERWSFVFVCSVYLNMIVNLVSVRSQSVSISTNATQPFVTDGTTQMALFCQATGFLSAVTYNWLHVTCINKNQDRDKCIFTPRVPHDDGLQVLCLAESVVSFAQMPSNPYTIQLNYPPPSPPIIRGYREGSILTEGETITLDCVVNGGKPKVRSVIFFCGDEPDNPDISDDMSVWSPVVINVRTKHNNTVCLCSATWSPQPRFYSDTSFIRLYVNGSRGGNAQNETTNGNEGERTSKKSDSSTSSPGQAAGNGSKSGGSTPRSSSSGSDKPSTNPNYTSTALQEVEIHPYMDLHTRDPTYASTTSSKDPHMYMELKTLKALQPGSEKNGNDGYETPQVPGQANKSSDGYETPQPPREGRRRSATYANQGVPADPIQEEVNYYNEA